MIEQLTARQAARLQLVEEHDGYENRQDLAGILSTFGSQAAYEDEPWSDHRAGHDAVRAYYDDLLRAVPDLQVDVQRHHVSDDGVILEVMIRGTHLGEWRGLPATGRRVNVPLCGVFTFDENDRLAGERIYYDRATVLAQLGVFHEPQTLWGRTMTALSHPVTMAVVVLFALRTMSRRR
jgi:steroid delta-isomerase-like uncharacterized protein